jgi:hypothetical protein
MKFNDAAGGQGLVQDAYFKVGLDATTGAVSYPIADLVRNANIGLDNAVALIISSDGRWQFDDSNYTDFPIATTDLVQNQQDYEFDAKWLDIVRIEIQDSLGNWHLLEPFDPEDLKRGITRSSYEKYLIPGQLSLTDYLKTPGQPILYDKTANSVFLYPKPNYAQAASLKVYFQRKMQYFTTADTTAEPGFMSNLHEYISICMAYAYAALKQLPQLAQLLADKQKYEGIPERGIIGKIQTSYARRSKDEVSRMRNIVRTKI